MLRFTGNRSPHERSENKQRTLCSDSRLLGTSGFTAELRARFDTGCQNRGFLSTPMPRKRLPRKKWIPYIEKLKDPRWQKKRLRIFERDHFRCRDCGAADKSLHAHHLAYVTGLDPWDYPDVEIQTLCDSCHATRTRLVRLILLVLQMEFSNRDLLVILNSFMDFGAGRLDALNPTPPTQTNPFQKIRDAIDAPAPASAPA